MQILERVDHLPPSHASAHCRLTTDLHWAALHQHSPAYFPSLSTGHKVYCPSFNNEICFFNEEGPKGKKHGPVASDILIILPSGRRCRKVSSSVHLFGTWKRKLLARSWGREQAVPRPQWSGDSGQQGPTSGPT